jgi:hypothetical protein
MFMPLSGDNTGRRYGLIAVMAVVGFAVTAWLFYPGVMTYDAKYVYLDMLKGFRGDWQSPVMTSLWGWIDPIAPGSGSMFLLIAGLYWLGFGLVALRIARQSLAAALVLLLLALSPPAIMYVAIIWRDVLFAGLWLVATALCFIVTDREPRLRWPVQVVALGLVAFGVLLRPNALIAAPVLVAYAVWPGQFRWKRAAILFVPAAIGLFALMQVVYYGVIGATRQHLVQTIMVFDLGGISHFAKENQFPGTWAEDDSQRIMNRCYTQPDWQIYWSRDPCQFVMQKLENEQHLFGTPAVTTAWLHAIARHPIAYLEHRAAFFWSFVGHQNLTLWIWNIEDESKPVLDGRAGFAALQAIDRMLKPTPLLRVGSWLLLCLAVCVIGWRRRDTPAGAFALAVCGSGALYVLTFFPVGVSADFRYAYWAVLAGIAGAVALTRRAA